MVKPLDMPAVIGHRGAAAYAPENTLASLREAKARGAAWVEFDVKLSGDGRLILMHDDDLRRTAGLEARVAATPFDVIRALDAGAWFGPSYRHERVPDFAAAIDELRRLGLGANVEIKPCPGREVETAIAVVDALDRGWPDELPTPLLSSFRDAALVAAQQKAPHWPRALLIDAIDERWQARAEAVGAVGINTNGNKLQAAQATRIKNAGYLLGVYTINESRKAVALRSAGADAIITDAPDVILRALS